MSLDLDNLGAAPDIENFDASKMDRGDALIADEPKDDPIPEDKGDEVDPKDEPTPEDKGDEPDPEPEPEPEDDDDEEEEQPRDEKGKFSSKEPKIPKSRFDEQVGKEREAREAAERRAAELERRLAEQSRQQVQTEQTEALEAEITDLEKKHAELLLDGNINEAAGVMKEIRMAERKIARAEATALASQQTAQALESDRMNATIARIESDYPAMNPESESYDADIVELVLAKQGSLMRNEGLTPSQAMSKAAKDVAERFLKPAEEPAKDEKGLAAAKLAEDRKQAQLKKNIDTAKKQPASMKESGIDSDKAGQTGQLPDVSKMTADEFDALPASTKAKLRGDFV